MSELAPRRLAVERPQNESLDEVIATASSKCRLCPEAHPLRKCPKFRRMSPVKRLSVVKRHKHCINCLAHSHFVKECRSRDRCMECLQEHHTMLHFHRRADGGRLGKNNASETNKPKRSNRRRNHPKRRAANNANSTHSKNKKSATHNQALEKPCSCAGQPPNSGNGAIMAASNTASGATIVINVLSR